MRIRSVIKWFLAMVLLAAVGTAGTVWWFWNRSDQILYDQLVSQLSEKAPGWNIHLGDAHFDWQNQSRVYLSQLSFQAPGQASPLLEIPSAVVYLDGNLLRDNMQVVIRKILIQDCHLNAIRHADGSWNLDVFKTLQQSSSSEMGFPEIHLNRASVSLEIEHVETGLSTQLSIGNANFRCIPGGQKLYQILGTAAVPRIGAMQLQGEWDIAHERWEVNGNVNGLPVDQSLLDLISDVEPQTREKMVRIEHRLHEVCSSQVLTDEMSFKAALEDGPQPALKELQYAEVDSETDTMPLLTVGHRLPDETGPDHIPNFGISGEMQVNFRLAKSAPADPLDYKFLVEVQQGEIDHALLPFPLRQVQGVIYIDRQQLIVRDITAVNGKTKLNISADLQIHGLTTPGKVEVSVRQMPLSDQLKRMLKPGLQKMYESLNPSGLLDLKGTFLYDGFGNWEQEDVSYEIYEGAGSFNKFPYPLHSVSGSIIPRKQDNGDLIYEYLFRGKAGQRPVTLTGTTRPAEQGGEAEFRMWCESLPLDETFLEACTPEVQTALRSLNLHGKADIHVSLFKPKDSGPGYRHQLNLKAYEASVEYEKFPYPIRDVVGQVSFDSEENVWHLHDVLGKHGDAVLTAAGTVYPQKGNSRLELSMLLSDAPIDHQLEHAVSGIVPSLWEALSPSGRVTAKSIITWMPDRNMIDVKLPSIQVTEGGLLLKSFRYAFDDVKAEMSYANGHVEIKKFSAKHDDTKIRGTAEYQLEPQGLWTLTFRDLILEDLLPDRQFRNALPTTMAEGLDSLAPEGRVTLEASLFELRGANRPELPITAAWDLTGFVAGMDMFVGVDVKDAHGKFSSRGIWDGRRSQSKGTVNLDSAFVLNQQLTQITGPFAVNDREIMIGAIQQQADEQLPPHMTAYLLGGKLSVDAKAVIGSERRNVYGQLVGEPTQYKAILRLNGARLEEYLRRQGGGAARLQGVMNGQLTLNGKGQNPKDMVGEGSLTIKPAALYELPVVLRIFQTLNITAPSDSVAFDEAFLKFVIRNEQFEFSQISLLGNGFSLIGRGTVRFDEKVDLVFVSIAPKSQLMIPLVREIVRSASHGWVAVDVKGTINDPKPKVKTNFVIDNALRYILDSFQPMRPLTDGNQPAPLSPQRLVPFRQ
ncbi:MAG: hypothetical protein P8M30_07630 [Planctomycetaceae bacterium]|nr:hypothetical protein [Planctomycetaceae bacterium]